MKAIVMVERDRPGSPESYACGGCRVFCGSDRERAERCCGTCYECGRDVLPPEHRCAVCIEKSLRERAAKDAARDADRFARAKKVDYAAYPEEVVYWDGAGSGDMDGDGYWSSLEALLEHCEQDEIAPPAYVWGVTRQHLRLDAEEILESAFEWQDFYEDARNQVPKELFEALRLYLDGWANALAGHLHAYMVDYTVAVVVPPEAEE